MPVKNIEGQVFGRLTAIRPTGESIKRHAIWECACSCGSIVYLPSNSLVSGNTTSCGCYQIECAINKCKSRIGIPSKNRLNLMGMTFGKLTVIGESDSVNNKARWWVRCSCGNEKIMHSGALASGKTNSCGCMQAQVTSEKLRLNLIGMKFERLTVVGFNGMKNHKSMWNVVCDCGTEKVVQGSLLTQGNTKSCGCYHIDRAIEANTEHGQSKTKEYRRAVTRKYRDASKILDAGWTTDMEIALYEMFPYCVVCGDVSDLTTDHVFTLSRGVGLTPGTATVLCRSCNSHKMAKDIYDMEDDFRIPILYTAQAFSDYWYA